MATSESETDPYLAESLERQLHEEQLERQRETERLVRYLARLPLGDQIVPTTDNQLVGVRLNGNGGFSYTGNPVYWSQIPENPGINPDA